MIDVPLISIVTPSYNRAAFVKQAITSVLEQAYPATEHIIVDGNSTDGTDNLLAKFPHLVTILEPDKGLYDAINKGIAKAQGEIIGILHTDDLYERGVFHEVARVFQEHEEVDAVIGQAVSVEQTSSGKKIVQQYPALKQDSLLHQLVSGPPVINAWFFKRKLFDQFGGFDLDFPIGADRDFLIRLCSADFHPYFVNRIFYCYGRHPDSLTVNSLPHAKERTMKENLRLARKYMNQAPKGSDFWRQCQTWHDLTSIEMAILLTRQLKVLDLMRIIGSAIQHNWKWLFLVFIQSPERIRNFLFKKGVVKKA